MKRLVTANEIRDMYFAGRRLLVLPPGAIITPGARDLIYAFNFEVRVAGDEAGAAAGPAVEASADGGGAGPARVSAGGGAAAAGEDLRGAVERVVDSVLANASPEDRRRVIDAVVERLSAGASG